MSPALLIIVTGLCLSFPLSAQTAREEIATDRNKAGGIYCLYAAPKDAPVPAPKGFKPFYISYFGRHGARHNLADPAVLLNWLDQAAAAGKLTPLGEEVRSRYTALYPQLKLREGDLTAVGTAQLEGIAGRMMGQYARVFRKGRTVRAVSSTAPRCLLSMAAFLHGLRSSGWK
ncbi:MAG: histidine-type phosphatase, partial [Bacteroidales bacterium]|nr:histidine-type phosphatase [Bacteroidales bacterium]